MPEPLLEVKDLHVYFPTEDGIVKAVDGISFTIKPGETLGVVGESGSGKSVGFLTVMGLINRKSAIVEGEVIFQGQDLLTIPKDELQAIRGNIFVTYAKQDAAGEDDVHGQGLGFVDEYDLQGQLVARVAQHGQLNAPWGLAMAPASFGRYKGDLLVGNFGDGQINAYASGKHGWHHVGTLRSSHGHKLVIDRLWALEFGNSGNNGDPDTLFFTAGPNDESDGLFGTITPR